MRNLVTGGTGFLGSHLVDALLLDAAAKVDLERFVHVSTTDVYGHPNQPVDWEYSLVPC